MRDTQVHVATGIKRAIQRRLTPLAANPFLQFAPPGHFYSPIPDLELVGRHSEILFDRQVADVPGIDLQVPGQLALLDALSSYYPDMPFRGERTDGLRYYFDNPFFSYADGIALYSMLRHFRPRRVIEVGSGFSSAVMLDTDARFLDHQLAAMFIDPNPQRLQSLMNEHDRARHLNVALPVQEVPIETFRALEPHDVLFIDSSHVAKVGSDVVHLLTHVLPALSKGVLVHFHDVLWPFEYPEEWIRDGRAWNESYVLKAFLQFNAAFGIRLFNSYLAIHHRGSVERAWPLALRNSGGSLWLEKIA